MNKHSVSKIIVQGVYGLSAVLALVLLAACGSGSSGGKKDVVLPEPVECKTSQFPDALKTQIQNKLNDDFALVPGAVVAIYHPDHGYVISAFGVADTSDDTPMPTDAVFDVGSVHKIFKWMLLEKLVDKGLVDFDENISSYVASPVITGGKVSYLPFHATGMVDIDESIYTDIWEGTNHGATTFEYSYSELMAFLGAENITDVVVNGFYVPGLFTLGTSYAYSSYGPVVAAEIAKEVTGEDPIDLINEYVIDELLLVNTSFHGYDNIPEKLVQGYGNDYEDPELVDPTGEHPQPNQNLMRATSSAVAGAIFSNACDLTHLSRSISDPELNYLSKSIIDSRIASPRDVGGYLEIARGVMKYDSQYSGNFWVHAGDGAHGHSSLTGYNPDKKMSITILTNFNTAYMEENYFDSYAAHFGIVQLIEDFY